MVKKILTGVISAIAGYIVGLFKSERKNDKEIEKIQELSDKHYELFMLMNLWVKLKQSEKSIVGYLEKMNYRRIAIYGMGHVGRALINELYGSDIEIMYGIDKNAMNIYEKFNIVKPDEKLNQVDAIIVTSITYFDEVKDDLCKKIDYPIISLKDILYAIE